jgi:hypothetical protein
VRRPSVLALICMVLVAVTTGLLAGCVTGRPDTSEEAAAHLKAQDTMIRQLEALPGATVTAGVESGLDTGQNNVGVHARLPGKATVAEANALGDSIERIIWLSHLDPLGRISIALTRAGSAVRGQQRLYIGDDKDALGVKYGPRPDGLTGY